MPLEGGLPDGTLTRDRTLTRPGIKSCAGGTAHNGASKPSPCPEGGRNPRLYIRSSLTVRTRASLPSRLILSTARLRGNRRTRAIRSIRGHRTDSTPRRRRSHTASSPDRLPDITGGLRVTHGRDATRP